MKPEDIPKQMRRLEDEQLKNEAMMQAILQQLQDQFGVSTIEEAKKLFKKKKRIYEKRQQEYEAAYSEFLQKYGEFLKED